MERQGGRQQAVARMAVVGTVVVGTVATVATVATVVGTVATVVLGTEAEESCGYPADHVELHKRKAVHESVIDGERERAWGSVCLDPHICEAQPTARPLTRPSSAMQCISSARQSGGRGKQSDMLPTAYSQATEPSSA